MAITRTLTVQDLDAPITTGTTAAMVAGTITEVGAFVGHTANAEAVVSPKTPGGAQGALSWARAGDDLVITSASGTDTSAVSFIIAG